MDCHMLGKNDKYNQTGKKITDFNRSFSKAIVGFDCSVCFEIKVT